MSRFDLCLLILFAGFLLPLWLWALVDAYRQRLERKSGRQSTTGASWKT